jgi:hypothetical protein
LRERNRSDVNRNQQWASLQKSSDHLEENLAKARTFAMSETRTAVQATVRAKLKRKYSPRPNISLLFYLECLPRDKAAYLPEL